MAYFKYKDGKELPYGCSECGFAHADLQSHCDNCYEVMEKDEDEYLILLAVKIDDFDRIVNVLVRESCL